MIKLTDILNEDENPCWKGYKQLGMKTKNGKEVPNCVPESIQIDEEQMDETMLVRIGALARKILPKDAFQIKMSSFQDADKAKERQNSMLRDLTSLLNRFYKNYNLNVRVNEAQVVNKKTGKDITKHVLDLLSGKIDQKTFEKLTGLKKESVNEEEKSPEEILMALRKMAMGDLERIADYANMISDRMNNGQDLSAWMYSQITLAVDQLNSVHDTMDGNDGIKEVVSEVKGRGITTIQKDIDDNSKEIKKALEFYKKNKNTDKAQAFIKVLKKLNKRKQELTNEFDRKVSQIDRVYADNTIGSGIDTTIGIDEDLRKWLGSGPTGGWDRYSTTGEKLGKCGDAKDGEPYSACLSNEKAKKLGKDGIASFVRRKRAAQKKAGDAKKGGEQSKGQKPTYVKTGA